jgi:pyruvate dehydrogenase E1 component alpha subunit
MSDPGKYRTKEEVEGYKHRDPLESVRAILVEQKWSTEEKLNQLDEQVKARVQQSVDFAEASPYPDPSEIYTDVYVEEYPFIIE